jgi:hypothetical protein
MRLTGDYSYSIEHHRHGTVEPMLEIAANDRFSAEPPIKHVDATGRV